ncbi:hypothetical protein J3P84_19665 [Pseudomonas sp. Z1-29]|uniref:hypothetical protein n=1 Tax=Pseudomonas sp. Z1-29 TaxID=2817410 RepID=UPI003DA7ADA9
MQISDAVEVVQVAGPTNANQKLAEGWTLLAVVPGANAEGKPHVAYVLGKPKEKTGTGLYGQPV